MTIFDELRRLPELEAVGQALVQFTRSLHPGDFVAEGKRWVYEPNFVTFTIQWQRAHSIAVTVRGYAFEFPDSPVLKLEKDRGGYSIFRIESPRQLAAAPVFIERAHELALRGAARPVKRVVVKEE